jgi:hypothetical protein
LQAIGGFTVADFIPGQPDNSEHAPYYGRYISLVPEGDVLRVLDEQTGELRALLGGLSEGVAVTRHPPYTWSTKEVVGHLTDADRIFGYRALRFARADATALPGFEENDYVRNGGFDVTPLADLLAEWEVVRRSYLHFFRRLDAAAWRRRGVACESEVSVRALAYIIAGHTRHHLAILRKRLTGN